MRKILILALLSLFLVGCNYVPADTDYFLQVQKENVPDSYTVHKFGRNSAVAGTIVPITDGGFYRTPRNATSLEIVSGSSSDSQTGPGARNVSLIGLDSNWNEQTVNVGLNGTSAIQINKQFLRLYRSYVIVSGQYANQSSPSQIGEITIRETGGGDTWAKIPTLDTGFGSGQSLIGAYTVPAGHTCYILRGSFGVDSTKSADIFFFKRENSDDVTVPYTGIMRVQNVYIGADNLHEIVHKTYESFPEKTDLGYLGQASVSADVSAEFELLCEVN